MTESKKKRKEKERGKKYEASCEASRIAPSKVVQKLAVVREREREKEGVRQRESARARARARERAKARERERPFNMGRSAAGPKPSMLHLQTCVCVYVYIHTNTHTHTHTHLHTSLQILLRRGLRGSSKEAFSKEAKDPGLLLPTPTSRVSPPPIRSPDTPTSPPLPLP